MKKYLVSIDNIEHYQAIEIEAEFPQEAEEKYQQMLEYGEVLVVGNEFVNLIVKEQ